MQVCNLKSLYENKTGILADIFHHRHCYTDVHKTVFSDKPCHTVSGCKIRNKDDYILHAGISIHRFPVKQN